MNEMKENIEYLKNSIEKIKLLKPISFRWKKIARTKFGYDDRLKYNFDSYTFSNDELLQLIPMLVDSIKYLNNKVIKQQTEINKLKKK